MEGEDLQIKSFFRNQNRGFYVDIGAFHPTRINNTYLLYQNGWSGINIDISNLSIIMFNLLRPKDLNINCAIGPKKSYKKIYYQKEFSPLNTLDKNLARKRFIGNFKSKKVLVQNINKLIQSTKFINRKIDFLNIDTEGLDMQIIQSLNFRIFSPRLICIENSEPNISYKKTKSYKFLKPKGYGHLWSGTFSHIYYKK